MWEGRSCEASPYPDYAAMKDTQMKPPELCQCLEDTTYFINVYFQEGQEEPELISAGSGVAVNSRADLLTAAHVVTSRLPVRQEDVKDPNSVILAMSKGGPLQRYEPIFCSLRVTLDGYLTAPLTVDLALLRPISSQSSVPFLPISTESPVLGTQVLMAGYPDDMELPFAFDRLLNQAHWQVQAQRFNVDIARRLLMIRSGIVGHRSGVVINEQYAGHIFYIDNVLHSGASGGPVINYDGEIVGVLTERAITAVPYEESPKLRVPSGAAVAVTPCLILEKLRQVGII